MVSHGQVGQATTRSRADDVARAGERVEARARMAVEIDECAIETLYRFFQRGGHQTCGPRYFLKSSKCSRAIPVPRATQCIPLSATWQGLHIGASGDAVGCSDGLPIRCAIVNQRPVPDSIAGTVLAMILRSSQNDQRSMYSRSFSTQ